MCSLDVLFLHGAKFSSQTWYDKPMQSLQILSKLGYNAVAIDLPGTFNTLTNWYLDKQCRPKYGYLIQACTVYQLQDKKKYMERSGSVVECMTRDRGFEPHWGHCFVVLEQDTFILA